MIEEPTTASPQRPVPPASTSTDDSGFLPNALRSVRFRLTLLYSVMLFGVASIVVGGIYWGLSRTLDEQISREMAIRESGTIAFDVEQDLYEQRREFEILVDQRTLETLRTYSIAGLGALFIMSVRTMTSSSSRTRSTPCSTVYSERSTISSASSTTHRTNCATRWP